MRIIEWASLLTDESIQLLNLYNDQKYSKDEIDQSLIDAGYVENCVKYCELTPMGKRRVIKIRQKIRRKNIKIISIEVAIAGIIFSLYASREGNIPDIYTIPVVTLVIALILLFVSTLSRGYIS